MEREGEERISGFVAVGMPEHVTRTDTFDELRENLVLYAKMREEAEAKGRTHYRTLVSFERQTAGTAAAAMVREWISAALPDTLAVAFVHQNTSHTHAHVWIDARKVDGKKLDLSPRQYRTLDEAWNRVYSRAMGRDEEEHLNRKHYGKYQQKENGQRNHAASPNGAQRESAHPQRDLSATTQNRAGATPGRKPVATPGERFAIAAVSNYEQSICSAKELHRETAKLDSGANYERRPGDRERGRG